MIPTKLSSYYFDFFIVNNRKPYSSWLKNITHINSQRLLTSRAGLRVSRFRVSDCDKRLKFFLSFTLLASL